MRSLVCAFIAFWALACCPPDAKQQTLSKCVDSDVVWTELGFLGSEYCPPEDWSGPVFTPLTDYPNELGGSTVPWKRYDFRKGEAPQYLEEMLDHALSDSELPIDREEVPDWKPATRRWFHAPWLNTGVFGREFAHGLTRERTSLPGELHPLQRDRFQNWAVSVFNARGGHALGQVWKDRRWPRLGVLFPEDTFVVKFLFTTAAVEQVPYLVGAPEWTVGIHVHWDRSDPLNLERRPRVVRLLQVDVAAKDHRSPVGWVFGSFVYHREAQAEDPWRRLLPLGLAWGNSFGGVFDEAEMWIDPATESLLMNPLREAGMRQDLGWKGRLNGPVDGPGSGCISCHATAQVPVRMPETGDGDLGVKLIAAPDGASEEEIGKWFVNTPSGKAFLPETSVPGLPSSLSLDDLASTDYSLQVMFGIENFRRTCRRQRDGCQLLQLQEVAEVPASDDFAVGNSYQLDSNVSIAMSSGGQEPSVPSPPEYPSPSPEALDSLRFDTLGELKESKDQSPLMREGG